MSSNSKAGGNSAWSRPLNKNNSGRFDKSNNSGSGGGHRPPPGMEGRKDFGSSSSSADRRSSTGSSGGGWGNRGAGGSSNGYAKKTYPPASSANSTGSNVDNTNNAGTTEPTNHNHVLRERFLHLILSMVGQTVTLTTTSGQVLEGIFHTFSPFNSVSKDMRNVYVIKAVRVIKKGTDVSSNEKITEEGTTVFIPSIRVASVHVKSMRLDATNVVNSNQPEKTTVSALTTADAAEDAAFATDSQISGRRGGHESLVAAGSVWTSAGDGGSALQGGGGLESNSGGGSSSRFSGGGKGADALNWRRAASQSRDGIRSAPTSGNLGDMKGSIGDWDQFSANEKKFNVKASFDENLYTTKLDFDSIDAKKQLEAERLAAEIEGQVSTNIHIATERNQALQTDYDDEDLYSGVLTKDLKAREVPDSEKKKEGGGGGGGKVMNYAAAAQAASKKGTSSSEAEASPSPSDTAGEAKGAEKSNVEDSTLPDLSKVKVSSEEKKVETENDDNNKATPADKTDSTNSDDVEKKTDGEESKKDEKKTESKPKLNPNAKSFSFNPSAKSFTPTFSMPPAPPPVAQQMQPLPPMDGQMMQHHPQEYPGGPMMGMGGPQYGMPGMMPMMNAQHPQMRQQYPPPYGAQNQQPLPPPVPGSLPPPAVGQDDASVNTGEGSDNAAATQQQQPQQQQYMQQQYGALPGAYPGYPYGQMQGRGGYPQMHPHQMQVLPPGGMYAPRMYAPQQHMLPQHMGGPPGSAAAANMMHHRGPPQPYYGGPGGGYNQGGYSQQQHGGGGSNPDQDKNRNNNNGNNNNNNMQRGNSGGGGRHGNNNRGNNNNSNNNKGNQRKFSGRGGGGGGGNKQYHNSNSQESGRSSDGGNDAGGQLAQDDGEGK